MRSSKSSWLRAKDVTNSDTVVRRVRWSHSCGSNRDEHQLWGQQLPYCGRVTTFHGGEKSLRDRDYGLPVAGGI